MKEIPMDFVIEDAMDDRCLLIISKIQPPPIPSRDAESEGTIHWSSTMEDIPRRPRIIHGRYPWGKTIVAKLIDLMGLPTKSK